MSFLDFVCRCRTCAFNCKCARVYIVYTVGIWVCGGRGLWVYSVYIWIHACIWVYRLASDNTCEHLSIHTGWHLRIHMNIWVCGRAWRPCAAPLAGSVPESEKSPDFSFQSLRCDGWYTHRGLSDQCQHRKSYQTPLISVILVSRVSDWMAGMRWFIWSEPASEAATSVSKFPGGKRQWILNNGVNF